MLFLVAAEASLPATPFHEPQSPPALQRRDYSPYWRSVLAAPSAPQFAPLAAPQFPPLPTAQPGVKVELIDEGVDQAGTWFQTFRLTILSGGTVSDATVAIFNDLARIDEVFRAAQLKNPSLRNPAYIFVGQQMDVTIDPSTVFVYKETQTEQNGAAQKVIYYNRVVATYFGAPQMGIARTVEFPVEPRTQLFNFPDDFEGKEQVIPVPPGNRMVDYYFVAGESFDDVSRQVFGARSAKAAADLLKQSGWDPNKWPPAGASRARFFVETLVSYQDTRPNTINHQPSDPAAQGLWQRITAEREAAGIYAVQLARDGIVYQVAVGTGDTTARRAAKLLFNDEVKYPLVLRAAGLTLPADPAKTPAGYDPLLVGRVFQVQVPFADERFPYVDHQPSSESGTFVTKLANGTVINETDRPAGQSGLLRVIYYPNGYKYIVERPSSWTLLLLDFLHFQVLNIASPDAPREQRELAAREFQARMIWAWSRSIPRAVNDVPEALKINVDDKDVLLEVLAHPGEEVPWQDGLVYNLWFAYPIVPAAAVVACGTLILFFAAWRSRRAQERRGRPRAR